jgi:hypothetical protein
MLLHFPFVAEGYRETGVTCNFFESNSGALCHELCQGSPSASPRLTFPASSGYVGKSRSLGLKWLGGFRLPA